LALTRAGFDMEYRSYFFTPLPIPIFFLRSVPYRFGRRQSADLKSTAAAHNVAGIAGRIVNWILDQEVWWISRGGQLHFGSSCLLVARKTE
jgi:hypothetical protein